MEKEKKKAGRKPLDGEKREIKISIKFSESEMKEIEKLAKYVELPKTVLARNLLLFGLDEMKGFKRTGLLQVGIGVIKTSEFLKKFINSKEK